MDFDIDEFLGQPLTARLATAGPTVRPVWYLWEESAFWILTGPWARLLALVERDRRLALVVDVCDLATGVVRQVIGWGDVEVLSFDAPRGRRMLRRYLGEDENGWDVRFRRYLDSDPDELGTVWLWLRPELLKAQDLSFKSAAGSRAG